MVSHSSSASLSSFQFSHASSSSLSSPPSSPDSSQDRFAAPASSSSSPPPSSTLALVPFLWEERPGVLKKAMQISEGGGHDHSSCREVSLSDQRHPPAHACTHRADSCTLASKRMSRAFPVSRSKVRSESVPHLPPPPCLSQLNLHVYVQGDDDGADKHHHQWGTSVGDKSKVMPSFFFHKRQHRRASSLEEDPFWMAMVACTNDEGKGSRMRFKTNKDEAYGEMQRTDSWFTRRVQGHSIHFEQSFNREKSRASSHRRNSKNNEGVRDAANKDGQHDCTDASVQLTHLASKAFKALNIAKSELHGRCKVLLQQQSAPVDISCTTRHSKKPSFALERKLPDLFGCKSHHPLSNVSSVISHIGIRPG